jgi:NitT/TauT family transport system substrate-binding protein
MTKFPALYLLLLILAVAACPAAAEEIGAAQYGSSTSGFPYAIALEKGFFKEAGVDITGIRGTSGGGADVRNLIAGGLPYADASFGSVVTAIQKGADLAIVSDNGHSVSSFVWVTKPDSRIRSVKDLKGARMGFSNPQSTSEALEHWLLDQNGYARGDVTLVSTSGFGPGLTALENGGVDITVIAEPIYTMNQAKYRAVIWARDAFPPMCNTVGVVSRETARKRPDAVRAIIVARRRAVEFMSTNRTESAAIIAKIYKLDATIIAGVLEQLIDRGNPNAPYWALGDFDYAGMETMVKASRLVGAITGEVDVKKMVDESFLPADLRAKSH